MDFQPVETRENLSYEEFFRTYALGNKPVVIKRAVRWSGAEPFSLELLARQYGSTALADLKGGIGGATGVGKADIERFGTLGNYLAALAKSQSEHTGKPSTPAPELRADDSAREAHGFPYLTNLGISDNFPELARYFDPPEYFLPNWIGRLFSRGAESLTRGELFIGPPSTSYGLLHFDRWHMHVGSCQLVGRKQWWIFPPSESRKLYASGRGNWYPHVSPVDILKPDLERYPDFASAQGFTAVLEPGDIIFCPDTHWHNTRNIDVAVSTAVRIANRSNIVRGLFDYAMNTLIDAQIRRRTDALFRAKGTRS